MIISVLFRAVIFLNLEMRYPQFPSQCLMEMGRKVFFTSHFSISHCAFGKFTPIINEHARTLYNLMKN